MCKPTPSLPKAPFTLWGPGAQLPGGEPTGGVPSSCWEGSDPQACRACSIGAPLRQFQGHISPLLEQAHLLAPEPQQRECSSCFHLSTHTLPGNCLLPLRRHSQGQAGKKEHHAQIKIKSATISPKQCSHITSPEALKRLFDGPFLPSSIQHLQRGGGDCHHPHPHPIWELATQPLCGQ